MDIIEHKKLEHYHVFLKVSVNGEEWQDQLRASSELLQKYDKLPGYEETNAPLDVVLAQKGEALLNRASLRRMADCVAPLLNSLQYTPVSIPKNTPVSVSADELVFTVEFVSYPVIEDLQFRGLEVEKPVKKCTEKDVDEALAKYMEEHPALRPVERDAAEGDTVEISFSALLNGKPVENGSIRHESTVLGGDKLLPGLDAKLTGHHAGEKLAIILKIPANFPRPSIAGKTMALDLTIDSVSEPYTAQCTDEFCQKYLKNVASVEQLREDLRTKLQAQYDKTSDDLYEARLHRALASTITCEVPAEMENTAYQKYREELMHISSIRDVSFLSLLEQAGLTVEQFNQQCRDKAWQEVRESLALDYIVRTDDVSVTQADVDTFYVEKAMISGQKLDDVKGLLDLDTAAESCLYLNAFKLFRSSVNTKEVEVDTFPEK